MGISVGIDLGTTFSAVAYINPKTKLPQIIPNREGKHITPSIIQFYDGDVIFGSDAEDAYNTGEPNCAASFKRGMGRDETQCYIDGEPYTAEQLSTLLLKRLKEDAELALGDTIQDAVITVPAYFYSKERDSTIRAANAAGIKVRQLIDEPNAAALAYGLSHWRENANILVYDLGGGTFDVTLVHMEKGGNLVPVATCGKHTLGGRDWDARLEQILVEAFEAESGISIHDDSELLAVLNGMSEGVKKSLSTQNLQSVKVSARFPGYGKYTVTITRSLFEERTSDLLEETGTFCRSVLEEAGVTIKDITDILLVGGSTRMPQVPDYLHKIFGKRPLSHVNPDEAVALGAAIQSQKEEEQYASLSVKVVGGKKKTDFTFTGLKSHRSVKPERRISDVGQISLKQISAHALGVIAIHDDDNRYYNEVIIPSNHQRPVRVAKRFRFITSPFSENTLAVYVVQGDKENPLAQGCSIPYKYIVSGIRHVPRGERIGTVIRIQYSYDKNGIIHVQARQEDDNVDLPIKREERIGDVSRFGRPVVCSSISSTEQLGILGGQTLAHKYKAITFSNVKWEQFDKISNHPSGAEFNEPKVHIIACDENIEFHGYNIRAMNEGVRYTIEDNDAFEIECDINTSTISPHPGGHLEINLGIISAQLNEHGGNILLDNVVVATVPSQFHLKMSLMNGGDYEIEVDGHCVGHKYCKSKGKIDVIFAFLHDSHYCSQLSHAYISDISMMQCIGSLSDDSPDTDTCDD